MNDRYTASVFLDIFHPFFGVYTVFCLLPPYQPNSLYTTRPCVVRSPNYSHPYKYIVFYLVYKYTIVLVIVKRFRALHFTLYKINYYYYYFLFSFSDWCISRQLWWGHRIPAYFVTLLDQDTPGNVSRLRHGGVTHPSVCVDFSLCLSNVSGEFM